MCISLFICWCVYVWEKERERVGNRNFKRINIHFDAGNSCEILRLIIMNGVKTVSLVMQFILPLVFFFGIDDKYENAAAVVRKDSSLKITDLTLFPDKTLAAISMA